MTVGPICRTVHTLTVLAKISTNTRGVRQWIGTVGSSRYRPDIFVRDAEAMAYALVEGWMNSPGHRANILDRDSRRIGVGGSRSAL